MSKKHREIEAEVIEETATEEDTETVEESTETTEETPKKKRARVTLDHICDLNGAVFVRIPRTNFEDLKKAKVEEVTILNGSDFQEQLDGLFMTAVAEKYGIKWSEPVRGDITRKFSADKFDTTKLNEQQKAKVLEEAKKLIAKLEAPVTTPAAIPAELAGALAMAATLLNKKQ